MKPHIEAVIVCLSYDDFLEQTIRVNLPHLDEVVVVTHQDDKGTRAVCERYGVRPVFCPYFESKGSPFNKALAINLGLANLSCSDWMLHLDADIALPRDTRRVLCDLPLDTKSIYGIDRVDCPSFEAWQSYLTDIDPSQKGYFIRGPGGWGATGNRLSHFDYGQWTPIGFFQLWNAASGITRYPTVQQSTAEHTDVLHGLQWARDKRHLIPEILGVHLLSGPNRVGTNWKGRKSPRFEPAPEQIAEPKQAKAMASASYRPPHHGHDHRHDHHDDEHGRHGNHGHHGHHDQHDHRHGHRHDHHHGHHCHGHDHPPYYR